MKFCGCRTNKKLGVAESRYEPLTESFEGWLRTSQNHRAIQQRLNSFSRQREFDETVRFGAQPPWIENPG